MNNRRCARRFPLLLCLMLTLSISLLLGTRAAAATNSLRVMLGQAVVPLSGPWKFHTGDDPRWADPNFDDSSWETMDLTPPSPDAHDPDVGLTGYVAGWQAKGHRGYYGYAWYRIRLSVDSPPDETLALCAPYYVDGSYQVFLNGQFLGGTGDFSKNPPVIYNIHIPKFFPLPKSLVQTSGGNENALIAVRVWTAPFFLGDPQAGGIHITPSLGTIQGVKSLYQWQWLQVIYGYVVDASESLFFLVLAVMACTLIPFDRADPAYFWLVAALLLIAGARGNQAVFFWWQFESFHEFEVFTGLLFVPLSLGAWTLAWCYWFRLREREWMPKVVGVLTLLYVISQFLLGSWFYRAFPHWVDTAAVLWITSARWLFVLFTLLIIFRVASHVGNEKWFALPAILLASVGLFAQELSKLRIPGIWFPFGVGVSRTQYAYAFLDVALFILFLHRLYSFRRRPDFTPASWTNTAGPLV